MSKELVPLEQSLAEDAARYTKQERVSGGGQAISLRGGILRVGDYVMPGNQIACVIVDSVLENTYYAARYNPEAVTPPTCYAVGRDLADMAPDMPQHPHFKPQSEQCSGCPMAEYGTSDTGKGKACGNKRRIALLPAGMYSPVKNSRDFELDLFEGPEHYAFTDLLTLKLPVTSVRNYGEYVQQIGSQHQRPPYAVFTRVFVEPDPKSQFKVHFELIDLAPRPLWQVLRDRSTAAGPALMRGYEPPTDDGAPKSGLRKPFGGR